MTVRLFVLLFERSFVELLQAEGAREVLRVKLLGHGGDAAASDRLLAAGAERAAALVVVYLAVRLAVVFKETAVHKRGEALLRVRDATSPRASTEWTAGIHPLHCQLL